MNTNRAFRKHILTASLCGILLASAGLFGCSALPSTANAPAADTAGTDSAESSASVAAAGPEDFWRVRSTETVSDDGCLTCHGTEGFHAQPSDHDNYDGAMCLSCHSYVIYGMGGSGPNGAPDIPHTIQDSPSSDAS